MICLYVPKNKIVTQHILINDEMDAVTENIIVADENSEVIIIEEYAASSQQQYTRKVTTEIFAEKNAKVHYAKIQNSNVSSTHDAALIVHQKQNSSVNLFSISQGALTASENITVYLEERGAECWVNGYYPVNRDEQNTQHNIFIDHRAEHTRSDILYKGVLDNKSRAAFCGKVYVHPDAQHIVAHQANHNLLLSRQSEVDTKPELEIYADDVKCSHGATVGRLDDDKLFYLRARGISHAEAMKLLIAAFAADVIARITHPFIKEHMSKIV